MTDSEGQRKLLRGESGGTHHRLGQHMPTVLRRNAAICTDI
jgi:hypothetical protein